MFSSGKTFGLVGEQGIFPNSLAEVTRLVNFADRTSMLVYDASTMGKDKRGNHELPPDIKIHLAPWMHSNNVFIWTHALPRSEHIAQQLRLGVDVQQAIGQSTTSRYSS